MVGWVICNLLGGFIAHECSWWLNCGIVVNGTGYVKCWNILKMFHLI